MTQYGFASPDGKVKFYVFSPQWNGEAKDIALLSNEELKDEKKETLGATQIKRWTVRDKRGKYARSYEKVTHTQQNTSRILGIEYADKAALQKYKDAYLHFKNSLQQFAD